MHNDCIQMPRISITAGTLILMGMTHVATLNFQGQEKTLEVMCNVDGHDKPA